MKKIKRKVTEFFNLYKKGKKKKTVKKEGEYEEKVSKKGQEKRQEKQLTYFLIILGAIIVALLALWISMSQPTIKEYKGTQFKKVKDKGGLIFYETGLPKYDKSGEPEGNYYVYLRTNPQKLKDIPFTGNLTFTKYLVINDSKYLNCEGDKTIAIANIENFYSGYLGLETMRDKNATCDEKGRYTYLNIKRGEETKVKQFGPSCYEVTVENCEVLPATEKFLAETIAETNKIVKKNH